MESHHNGRRRKLESGGMRRHREDKKRNREAEKRDRKKIRYR